MTAYPSILSGPVCARLACAAQSRRTHARMSAPAALPALPFPQDTADALFRLTQGLEPAGLWWLSGYAAGLASRSAAPATAATTTSLANAADSPRLTILYGSQTGNARRAAEALLEKVQGAGLPARLVR